ncbi:S1/P1 nuclease [Saccharospirillum sp. HFRX-1]|uniref:S1/P1 nuclease n=1 Tax=unclassified Saccharospirillum TaxID=2633430 RepID=UPI00371548E1
MARREKQSPRLILAALLLCLAGSASAFNEQGHRLVVQLAELRLNEAARAGLEDLYGPHWRTDLVNLASWAEEHAPAEDLRTVLFDAEDEGFEAAKHCPRNRCVVGAILESRLVLIRNSYEKAEKRRALQYLIHFMTDLHIPVNAGLARDQAGRLIALKTSELERVNLNWVWTQSLYRELDAPVFATAQRYQREITDEEAQQWLSSMSVVDWAWETHQIAMEVAYPLAVRGEYDAAYRREALPVLEVQLKKAAVRLAALLNTIYGDA